MRRSSPTTPKPGRSRNPANDEPSLFEIHRESSAVQPLVQCRPEGAQQGSVPSAPGRAEDALQALENRAARSPCPFCRQGWANTILICLRAVSSASAVAFGSIWTVASRAGPAWRARAPWSCGRILNSSGQDCWFAGSALTQEIWSKPSAFIRATRRTGNGPISQGGMARPS